MERRWSMIDDDNIFIVHILRQHSNPSRVSRKTHHQDGTSLMIPAENPGKTILITSKNFIHSGLSTISLKGNLSGDIGELAELRSFDSIPDELGNLAELSIQ
ncbi:hypothetical protein NC651_024535 [Populus alba x Populus x berolinensis]|nr:hypothetical protein NC651_024535 [Populus alba x Populus x berolinensis]